MHRYRVPLLLIVLSASLASCRNYDRKPEITAPRTPNREVSASVGRATRLMPWAAMSDDSLAKRIAAVGGRVVIGFREPNAPLALTEAARTPVSRATRDAAKIWMRSQGIKILHEYRYLPAVEATIDPNQVAALRANPRIEMWNPMSQITRQPRTRATMCSRWARLQHGHRRRAAA